MLRVASVCILYSVASFDVWAMTFEDVSDYAQKEICESFISNVKCAELKLIRTRPEDVVPGASQGSFCSKDVFLRMLNAGFYPSYSVCDCMAGGARGPLWIVDTCIVRRMVDIGVEYDRIRKNAYRPALALATVPLLAFVKSSETNCMDNVRGMGDVNSSNKRLVAESFQLVRNLSFAIEGLSMERNPCALSQDAKKVVDALHQNAVQVNARRPPITLSRREATEFVYVTSLCRGMVSSMKEFNETIVKRNGVGFMVELTVEACETEFGRRLYQKAKKNRLLPDKRQLRRDTLREAK